MVKRVLAIILATIISFTAVETTGLFFVSANNVINSYENSNADIQEKKDEENDYYYFTVYTSDGTGTNDDNLYASKLTYFTQVMTGSGEDNDGKLYYAFVMANGKKVTATDVTDEDGNWVATKLECADGSYVKTNYDAIHLFGGSHNSDTPIPKTDVTLSGTTHVQSVWGGGFHKSQVTEANVTVEGETRVAGIQGGAAAYFAGAVCGVDGCGGYDTQTKQGKSCINKPSGNDAKDYNIENNARVDVANVTIKGYGGKYTPPTTGKEKDTLIYGGGESYAYTGESTVIIEGGDLSDAFVCASGSNGYTDRAEVKVSGNGTVVGELASANRGVVGNADITVSGGIINELIVGADDTAEIKESNITVSGGTVKKVKFGNNGAKAINPDSDEGFTVKANGGKIEKFGGENVGYGSKDVVCNHGKYEYVENKGTDATCADDGTKTYYQCNNCHRYYIILNEDAPNPEDKYEDVTNIDGSEVDDNKIKINALGHNYAIQVPAFPATCVKSGMSEYHQCIRCGDYEPGFERNQLDKDTSAHQWGDWEVTKKPTCYEKGEVKRTCELCHKEETKEIDNNSIAHQWDDWEVTKKPTCNEKGEEKRTCELCHKEETKEIDNNFIAHQWDDWEVIKEPTCNEKGEEKRTCELCHKEETKEIDKNPSAHKYKNDGICQLCGQKDPGYVVVTQSGSNVTTSKDTSKNNKKNAKIVKIINSRNKTKVKIKKKKIIIKFSRRGGCKYRIKIYNKKNKEISLKVKQDYMKGNGKKKFKKFYQIKKKGDYRIEIYELKGMKEKNFKDVKCIYLNYKTIK